MDLVFTVLVLQHLDELMEPLLRKLDEQTTGVTQLWVVWIEDIGCKQSSKVDDHLFVRWHKPFPKGTDHLVRVQLLVELSLVTCQKQFNV